MSQLYHFNYNDKGKITVKGWEKLCHTTINKKNTRVPIKLH